MELETDANWTPNHPGGGLSQDLGFAGYANQFRPTEATFTLDADLGRGGFHLDAGAGDFYRLAMSSDSVRGANQYVSQAYAFWKPTSLIRIDAGKFFSSVGAEVPQSSQDFNITRSLLFWYGSPLYHMGVRGTMTLGAGFTVGAQMLSGSNTLTGSHGHQTPALTAAWTGKYWGISQIYMDGDQKQDRPGGRRLSDTVLTFTPMSAITGYAEVIAAVDKRATPGSDSWYGWATAWKVSRGKWSVSPRLDWLNDPNGATTGTSQRLFEFTMTGEYRVQKFATARLEYRTDRSNQLFYQRAEGLSPVHGEQAVVLAVLLHFEHELKSLR